MKLAPIVEEYYQQYLKTYGNRVRSEQKKALQAIRRCRTPECGTLFVRCPQCNHTEWRPRSCGNRHCPQCQNHAASNWIDKQSAKLLPVTYFMVTFTLPFELRQVAERNQKTVYSLLFATVAQILKEFGLNPRHLGAEIGMTMVLHTHTRRLEYHPHIHVIIPGGGIDRKKKLWRKLKGKYLFNGRALAAKFRGRFLAGLSAAGLHSLQRLPRKWVAHCENVGKGGGALKYLSKYLYRGVISERNIVANSDGKITFKYVDGKTGKTKYRTVPGEKFLHLLMQHVLPSGFRRVRDYGFLHGNAGKMRRLIQLILHVILPPPGQRERPAFKCPCCKAKMVIIGFRRTIYLPG